tara:strand:- start:539 stop:763 length:225 start_codon:yes stop_codon:yes gene_type:complete
MKTKPNKITNKEIAERLNFLLLQTRDLQNKMSNILELINDYMDYKEDLDGFKKHIEKQLKEAEESETQKTISKK